MMFVILLAALAVLPAAATAESPVAVAVEHVILSRQGDDLTVFQIISLRNGGGEPVPELQVSLPPGYADLTVMKGTAPDEVVPGETGFVDTSGLAAGATKEMVFLYRVPLTGLNGILRKDVHYRTELLYFLVEEGEALSLAEERLSDYGPVNLDGRKFYQYGAENLPAGTELAVRLREAAPGPGSRGTAAPGTAAGPSDLLNASFHGGEANVRLWMRMTGTPGHAGLLGVGLFLVVIGAGAVVAFKVGDNRRRARREARVADLRRRVVALEEERQELMRRLVDLELAADRSRETGVDEPPAGDRQELKERLVNVTMELRRLSREA